MISKESLALLAWVRNSSESVTLKRLEEIGAPYAPHRLDEMCKMGYMDSEIDVDGCDLVGIYFVTEKGLAELEQAEQVRQDRTDQRADKKRDRQITVISALAGSIVTLAVEHWHDMVAFFSRCLP